MIFSVAFKAGKAYFRNKFVKTKGFLEEQVGGQNHAWSGGPKGSYDDGIAPPSLLQALGKAKYRNAFTSGSMDDNPFFNPFDINFKNVANTCVLHWGGKLYALWEVRK